MTNRPASSVENNFVGGLKTEFSALNFPENACVDADNVVFSILGTSERRGGFNFETNYQLNTLTSPASVALSDYKWNNVGGDGETQVIVQQIGGTLYFYLASSATITNPLSKKLLGSTVSISSFVASGGSFDPTIECQYTDGNGFLFVFHPDCDPFYCTYNAGVITATIINIQVRDVNGIIEPGVPYNLRPQTLSAEHQYNLINQGWGAAWTTSSSTTNTIGTGSFTFTVDSATLPILIGDTVTAIPLVFDASSGKFVPSPGIFITGTVTAYSGVTLTFTETANAGAGTFTHGWSIVPSPNYINTFFNKAKAGGGDIGTAQLLNRFPSNAEQWWWYRSTNVSSTTPDGTFKPSTQTDYVVLSNFPAPKGSIIFDVFNQDRSLTTGITGLTAVTTTARPVTGCWYEGRVFYSGVNASQQASGDASYYTWTEDIYFSKIMEDVADFAKCYQVNDPTNDKLFNLLPSDGGVITIQGSGAIYKLFPLKFGILVFAANGIWFVGGSSGIGFTATDYSITKISNVQSISGISIINVLGWPIFWNEEGIYEVKPTKDAGSARSPDIGLDVNNLALGTILSFYNSIPLQSKKYARGDYNPITFVIQWIYRDTNETGISDRYKFNRALNINTYKAPFYPYSFTVDGITVPSIASVRYVAGPGGSTSPDPVFKYLTVYNNQITYSEENDFTNWTDWEAVNPQNYISTFTTGFKIHGQAQRQFGVEYIYVFTDNNEPSQYSIQSLWNFASTGDSGKWSGPQIVYPMTNNFGTSFRRIRLRGHGIAVQFKFTSVTGKPFNIIGWSVLENQSGSV